MARSACLNVILPPLLTWAPLLHVVSSIKTSISFVLVFLNCMNACPQIFVLQLRISSEGYLENINTPVHGFVINPSFCCFYSQWLLDFKMDEQKIISRKRESVCDFSNHQVLLQTKLKLSFSRQYYLLYCSVYTVTTIAFSPLF